VFNGKLALHVGGQLIPEGTLETVPAPVPARLTDNVTKLLKVAVTCWLALIVKAQVALVLPLQGPLDHLAKYEFVPPVAVRVTGEPAVKFALQVGAQLIPEGLLVTVPTPVP
jgi:hypothetical protein